MKTLSYGRQNITQEDLNAVTEALQSDYLTQGPRIAQFEEAFSKYIGCKYSVAVANGTAALHLAAMVLDVNEKSRVITTPITFAASANCVRYCDGTVEFADIDPSTWVISIPAVEKMIKAKPAGYYSGIIPVDFAGAAVNLEGLRRIAKEHNLWVLEDACHAPGGYFIDSTGKKQNCGNGNFADLAVFSFHPVKHIATGEGGMITTNDEELYKKLLVLRTHGIVREAHQMQDNHGPWYYEMQELGYNYRFTDFQSALGLSQLQRADAGIARRFEIAQKYSKGFADLPLQLPAKTAIEGHAYHLYVIRTQKRLELYQFLSKNQIKAQVHYVPVHTMPYYRNFGWKNGDFPTAEKYYSECLSLPMYPSLTDEDIDYVIKTVRSFFDK
jgi:UDP-4-amino-4,6-dideoxy-N-acetyl-beta-L-altrosamine transaminase